MNNGVFDRLAVKVLTQIYTLQNDEVYRDSSTITVSSFSTNDLTFSTYQCDILGDYRIVSYLTFDGDQYPRNDTLTSYFKVVEEYDLKLNRLIVPTPTSYILINSANLFPSIEVSNNGKKPIDSAKVDIQIEDKKGVMYSDSIIISLAIDEQKVVSFNKLLNFDTIGNYTVHVTNKWSHEQSPSANDTLIDEYFVRHNTDVAIDSHATPLNNAVFELTQPVNPKVSIRNNGLLPTGNIEIEVQVLKGNIVKV
ncbi:MAG: hypothetical protein KJP21_02565, partial [Bacteroidia bacterium]|nr:hypothetical protein [Bacteroidia bacterium]